TDGYLKMSLKERNLDDLIFGTVDTWLIWNMSKGHRHITDVSNASRTMMYDINRLEWSNDLTEFFHIPESILPEVVDSAAPELAIIDISGSQIPLNSIAGDQQASLFGHQAFRPGDSKCTYGTGSFVLTNTGNHVSMKTNLLTSIGWKLHGNPAIYCNEGSAFNTGSIIKWIRDNLQLIGSSEASEDAAMKSSPDHGLIFVPALSGLGAPFWLPSARGTIFGITGKTSTYDLVRSALESIAFRIKDIID
ncbi:protein containing Carbohydrate kinase, FGGY, partial [mine drainage metagenome]